MKVEREMKITLDILNSDTKPEPNEEVSATWCMRSKSYESDWMDEDMINSPVGHKLDRLSLDDVQITTSHDIDHLIEFLNKAKPCFKF